MSALDNWIKPHASTCLAGKYTTMGRCSCGRFDAEEELTQLRNDNVKLNKLSQTQTESIAESTKYILQLRTENTRLQKAVDTARYILIDVDTYEDKNSPVIEDEVKAWLDSNKETK